MYTLVAEVATPEWSGEVGRATFMTLEDAEKEMARWANFGVDESDPISLDTELA